MYFIKISTVIFDGRDFLLHFAALKRILYIARH